MNIKSIFALLLTLGMFQQASAQIRAYFYAGEPNRSQWFDQAKYSYEQNKKTDLDMEFSMVLPKHSPSLVEFERTVFGLMEQRFLPIAKSMGYSRAVLHVFTKKYKWASTYLMQVTCGCSEAVQKSGEDQEQASQEETGITP